MLQFIRDLFFPKPLEFSSRTRVRPAGAAPADTAARSGENPVAAAVVVPGAGA